MGTRGAEAAGRCSGHVCGARERRGQNEAGWAEAQAGRSADGGGGGPRARGRGTGGGSDGCFVFMFFVLGG